VKTLSVAVVLASATLAACGGTDEAPSGASHSCTITFARSIDDAHLQAALVQALRRQDPCALDGAMRASDPSPFELVRVERDEESVRAVFQAVPEMRPANPAG